MDPTKSQLSPSIELPDELVYEGGQTPVKRDKIWINILLFGATLLTTLSAGAFQQGYNPITSPSELIQGVPFSFTLLAILLTHEMGHYLTARYHRVDATLPYFIPAPPFPFIIGTFGAFIRMRSPIMNKRALLDIGASGPIAGFILSLVGIVIGLHFSEIVVDQNLVGFRLGEPIIFQFLSNLVVGPVNEGYDIVLHPIAFAGWIGLFLTAINLIPVGQLDGGHVVYAIFGKHHQLISRVMIPVLLAMGLFGWKGWIIWGILLLILGIRHPPTVNPDEKLDSLRKVIGWASLLIFVLCFTPTPFYV